MCAKLVHCVPCNHNHDHGHWGKTIPGNAAHCRVCHHTWTGLRKAHCVSCHRTFGSNSTADRAGCPDCVADDDDLAELYVTVDDDGVFRYRPPHKNPHSDRVARI